ncbi:hypothetical protein O6H91_01G124400 [Diphasiastrum complanatum]|uniref:Uncharacterized protein n=1 Tax=Diphasiastrum complanatum TaxID=34168 RepID=A0ACC2EVJ9_DIPCM|nr:hypothetical protein O6H91_01G124400 [Diphasiastrum complanatum]
MGDDVEAFPIPHIDYESSEEIIESNSLYEEQKGSIEVAPPPPKRLIHRLLYNTKEMLCPDDPFRQFKNQTTRKKCYLGLKHFMPILDWAPHYTLSYFKSDLISGMTIASLAIPQGIAFARLARLPPIVGLYTSFLPPLLYGIFGSSRDIALGPGSILSILLGSLLREEVNPAESPETYLRLAFTATFFAGLFEALLGALRFGFIIDFLSRAAIIGFISGVAIVVSLQQLQGILGITNFTEKADIVSVMGSVWPHPNMWNWRTAVVAASFLVFLLAAKEISKRNKNLFWVTAVAPLLSVFLTTVFVEATHAYLHIGTVGTLTKGLNPISVTDIYLHGPYALKAMKIGLITAMINVMETVAVGRTFAAKKDNKIDVNKELIALGIVNLSSSCFSCYIATGALSRSAVNVNAGCKTALSNVVMATLIMIILLALTPLFHYTPDVILSTIVFVAVIGLIDLEGAYFTWTVDKLDFLVCLGAFIGVIFLSINTGLLIAVCISVGKILLQITRPHIALLGLIPNTNIYQDIEHYTIATQIPGILIIRVDSPICFTNGNYIKERILRWVDENVDNARHCKGLILQYVIMDLTSVMSVDTTGIYELTDALMILERRKFQLVLAGPGIDALEKLNKSNFVQMLGQKWFFSTISEAVDYCSSLIKAQKRSIVD